MKDAWIRFRRKPYFIIIYIAALFLISRLSMYLIYRIGWKDDSFDNFLQTFNAFDASWYREYALRIVDGTFLHWEPHTDAAMRGMVGYAFFPLFPLINAGVWMLLRQSVDIYYVGLAVNAVFFCLAEYAAYRYILLTRKSERLAYAFIAFMSLGLYSFYFSVFYTEALFLFLLVLCFYFMKREQYLRMGIAGALLSLTRNVGVMFVFVILVDCIERYVRTPQPASPGEKGKRSFTGFRKAVLGNPRLVLGTCLVPLGLFCYMLFLSVITGDGLAFVHVERAWRGDLTKGFLRNLWDAVVATFPPAYLGVATIAVLCILIVAAVKERRFDEVIYAGIILVLGGSSILDSVPRYMVGSFVFVLSWNDLYGRMDRTRKVLYGILIGSFELVLIYYWLQHNSVLV